MDLEEFRETRAEKRGNKMQKRRNPFGRDNAEYFQWEKMKRKKKAKLLCKESEGPKRL